MTGLNCLEKPPIDKRSANAAEPAPGESPLHRLRAVRLQEELSPRTVARRMGLTTAEVRRQELETADLPLSTLYRWREALDVPLTELLLEPDSGLSPPITKRAQLVRIMKTAKYIMQQAKEEPIKRMAETMVGQLLEIMPELRDVRPWHVVGSHDPLNGYGRSGLSPLPDSMFAGAED